MAMIQQPVQSGFSRITQALSDPAREAMVSALADGKAMPAGELASVAGHFPRKAPAPICRSSWMQRCSPSCRRAGSGIIGSPMTTWPR